MLLGTFIPMSIYKLWHWVFSMPYQDDTRTLIIIGSCLAGVGCAIFTAVTTADELEEWSNK